MNTQNQNNAGDNNNAPVPAQEQGKWGRRGKTAAKVVGVGLGVAALGAGAWYGFQWFKSRQG